MLDILIKINFQLCGTDCYTKPIQTASSLDNMAVMCPVHQPVLQCVDWAFWGRSRSGPCIPVELWKLALIQMIILLFKQKFEKHWIMINGVKTNAMESDGSGDSFITFPQVLGLQTQLSGQPASCMAGTSHKPGAKRGVDSMVCCMTCEGMHPDNCKSLLSC